MSDISYILSITSEFLVMFSHKRSKRLLVFRVARLFCIQLNLTVLALNKLLHIFRLLVAKSNKNRLPYVFVYV